MNISSPTRTLNDRTSLCVAFIPFTASLPVASNRPVLWAMWGILTGLLAAFYLFMLSRRAPEREMRSLEYKRIFLCGGLMGFVAIFQMLPLGLVPGKPDVFADLSTISVDPATGLMALIRLATYTLLFIIVVEVATRERRIRRMQYWLFLGILAQAVFALVALKLLDDFAPWGEKTSYLGYATGSFINRNGLAMFLGMGACLGLGLSMDKLLDTPRRSPNGKRVLTEVQIEAGAYLLGVLVIFSALLATGSRMGLFSTMAGLVVVSLMMQLKTGQKPWRAALYIAAIGVPIMLIVLAAYGTTTIDRGVSLLAGSGDRITLWGQVVQMIADRPLRGFGLNGFELGFRAYHSEGLSAAYEWDFAHNTYLDLWVELGLIAGSMPLVCVGLAAMAALRRYMRRGHDHMRSAVAIAVMVQCAIHSVVDFGLETEANVLLFVVIMALGLARTRQKMSAP